MTVRTITYRNGSQEMLDPWPEGCRILCPAAGKTIPSTPPTSGTSRPIATGAITPEQGRRRAVPPPDDLLQAAGEISTSTLAQAKDAIVERTAEFLEIAKGLELSRMDKGRALDLARALSLTQIGYLPVRPETCPFCIQYGRGGHCIGCGYARTHGRCDEDNSAFSLFIEAFHELGSAIFLDRFTTAPANFLDRLQRSLDGSVDLAQRMIEDLPEASVNGMMELKRYYIHDMIDILPLDLLSPEVFEKAVVVQEALDSYW
ncbi:MAG: hypothetical protein JW986_05630 [Methanotrichaceae archaeon]|nr:hypothetical protein [Methanotrichaceae archaeon]